MSVYMSYCTECGDKMDKVRVLSISGGPHYGYCQGCFSHKSVVQYEVGPTWEQAERLRRRGHPEGRRPGERRRGDG